jgi:hypothetical protein
MSRERADHHARIVLATLEMPMELQPMFIGNISKSGWHIIFLLMKSNTP